MWILEILQALKMKASEGTLTQAQPITLHLNTLGQHADLAQSHLYGLLHDHMPLVADTIEPTQPMVEVSILTN